VPAGQNYCPQCGWTQVAARRDSLGKKHPALVILVALAAFLALAGTVGFTAYRFVNPDRAFVREFHKTERPVVHGSVVRPDELHGHGKLYFVPVGSQAIPVQMLADYYLDKFGARITVLPQVDIAPEDCVPERKQCVAEDLEAEMTTAYPEIARDPDSVMIALTDEDIFPRELDWNFTYSFHSARIGIVSTHRMDPGFSGDTTDDALRLARTKQMLTKYVAMLYYRVPASFDPTSVMYTPLEPDGKSDDLYESDLHSEETANGRRGTPYPCLFFTYSYQTHELKPQDPLLTDCHNSNAAHTEEETFELDLGYGRVTQRSMDLQLDSSPPIEFRRGYVSNFPFPMAMGAGANHTYDAYLTSNRDPSLSYIRIVHEDGLQDKLDRISPGRGFNPDVVFESHEDGIDGAQMTWDSDHFKLEYRDGAWSTFRSCVDITRCYWADYQDAHGHGLRSQRGPHMELLQLTSDDQQGISFRSDDRRRIIEAQATNGKNVSYDYDAAGCLAKVRRADGQVTLYTYDPFHRMTSVSVMKEPGAQPEKIASIQYDAAGRVIKQTLAGVGSYGIEYLAMTGNYPSKLKVTTPAGEVLRISIDEDDYVVRAESVRFPGVPRR
jgi:YD repeat-containing protein